MNGAAAPTFAGAITVAHILSVVAWLVFVGGTLLALGAAFDQDLGSGGQRFTYAVTISALALLWSLFAWAVSYGLLLLDHIDAQQRNRAEL